MATDNDLLSRVITILGDELYIEKEGYGGTVFQIGNHLVCGVKDENFLVQIGEDRFDEFLTHPLAKPLEVNGKPISGWVEILPTGTRRDVDLTGWVNNGLEYMKTIKTD